MFSKSMKPKSRFLLIGVLLASLVTTSCIFEPRASEKPPDQATEDIRPAKEPEILIENLIKVVEGVDSGNYPDLFAEDFGFVADPEDVDFMNNHYGPGIYLGWDKNVETTMADRLFDRIRLKDGAELNLGLPDVVTSTDSTYVVYHDYTLKILQEEWIVFEGKALFRMRKDPSDNLWYIYGWDDFRQKIIPDDTRGTWGLLKGEIRATT